MEVSGQATGTIVGPLVKDPDVQFLPSGTTLITLIIRVDNGYTSKSGHEPRIEEVPIKYFGSDATQINDMGLCPGDLISSQFKISGKEFKGKYYAEVIGRDVRLLGREAPQTAKMADLSELDNLVHGGTPNAPKEDEDLPF